MKLKLLTIIFISLIFVILGIFPVDLKAVNVEDTLRDMVFKIDIINNAGNSREVRITALNEMIAQLQEVLSTEAAKDLDISKYLKGYISCYDTREDAFSARVFTYIGPKDVLGSLERTWVFIQYWKEDNNPQVLAVEEGGPELPIDIKIINNYLVLIGYLIHYRPNPVYIQIWQIKQGELSSVMIDNSIGFIDKNWDVYPLERAILVMESTSNAEICIGFDRRDIVAYYAENEAVCLITSISREGSFEFAIKQ